MRTGRALCRFPSGGVTGGSGSGVTRMSCWACSRTSPCRRSARRKKSTSGSAAPRHCATPPCSCCGWPGSPHPKRQATAAAEVNLIDLRPADVVTFVGSLTANGVDDEALSGLTRREFDQCWHKEASFRKDLMAYLFRPEVYLERAFQAQEDIRDLMLTMDDFSEFVIAAAAREVRSATSDPVVALGSLVAASLPRDPHIQRLVAAVNQRSRASWTALYRRRWSVTARAERRTESRGLHPHGRHAHRGRARSFPLRSSGRDLRRHARRHPADRERVRCPDRTHSPTTVPPWPTPRHWTSTGATWSSTRN